MIPYGGKHEHLGFIVQICNYGHTAGGRCFPAGHASGGFALMSLYYLPLRPKWKTTLFYFGFIVGWSMGLYQMARGEHFISHTLTTMFMALTMITFFAKILKIQVSEYFLFKTMCRYGFESRRDREPSVQGKEVSAVNK